MGVGYSLMPCHKICQKTSERFLEPIKQYLALGTRMIFRLMEVCNCILLRLVCVISLVNIYYILARSCTVHLMQSVQWY